MTEDDFELVGLYVLGLLEGSQLKDFERRLRDEPVLRQAVERLQDHLSRLDETVEPLPANRELWQRIEAGLDGKSVLAPMPPFKPANDNRLTRWLSTAAGLVVALGVGYLAGTSTSQQAQPTMIAVLLTENSAEPGAIVEAFADDSIRLVPLDLVARSDEQTYQVWTLPDPETGPVSMGIFDDPRTIRLEGPNLPLPGEGQLYEITLEPAGGSPTGRPTGPILVKGFAKAPLSGA